MRYRAIVALLLLAAPAFGQVRKEIRFPDPPGYQVLKCDFHMHTVFSDGDVWPTVRVNEAWREGLDAIAITDHIEYLPHKEEVTGSHNRPYEIAAGLAKQKNILLVRGAEITRETPPGHFNVFFTKDNQPLDNKDLREVFKEAGRQGAFIMWNHPGWQGEERGRWGEMQTWTLENRLLHGIEICNGDQYYVAAHRMATERGLPVLGSSDIHEPAPTADQAQASHRTMTLVLAKDRSLPAVREALDAGRTIVWCKNMLIGREQQLKALFDVCVQMNPPHHRHNGTLWVQMTNRCDQAIEMERVGPGHPRSIRLPANGSTVVGLTGPDARPVESVTYKVNEFLAGVDQPLTVELAIPKPATQPASVQ
jgi:hypothetical protein